MSNQQSERVWKGDPRTVQEARTNYEANPTEGLLSFAVALYSFRRDRRLALELLDLGPRLIEYAAILFAHVHQFGGGKEAAEKADVLSTHLEWMSRQPSITALQSAGFRRHANIICERGLQLTNLNEIGREGDHTWCLLILTSARLKIAVGEMGVATRLLQAVEGHAPHLKDAKQRARVLAKLGLLYRRCGNFPKALRWGLKACLIPNIPLNVRMKAGAALLGVDQ